MIDADAGIALTDVTLMEVLQGIRDEEPVRMVHERHCAFDVLRLERLDDFRRAGQLYSTAPPSWDNRPSDDRLPHRLGVHT